MIYSDSDKCRFCDAPLDRQVAEVAAEVQEKVNEACNHAKWIRNMAGAMWILLLISFIFTAGTAGVFAFFFLIPLYLIFWQFKFGSLKTVDPDYQKAKRDRLIALALWLPAGFIKLLTFYVII
ncbi:MAG: hypothetical protein H7Y30_01865 [Pyrinomonadaceae bacterium]|nr:hypothetical protein [Pyrinomonadaceae bacterium]